jgi:hypothetical protein
LARLLGSWLRPRPPCALDAEPKAQRWSLLSMMVTTRSQKHSAPSWDVSCLGRLALNERTRTDARPCTGEARLIQGVADANDYTFGWQRSVSLCITAHLLPSLMCSDRHMAVSNQLAAGAIAIGTLAPDDVGIVARHRRYRAAGDTVIEWLSGDLNQSGCRL